MTQLFIITQQDFESHIPCAQFTDDSVFSKLTTAFAAAERELVNLYRDNTQHIDNDIALTFICNKAFASTVAKLDLSLSPNGFSVTNTENMAPASKDRVASLLSECLKTANTALFEIDSFLFNSSESPKASYLKHFLWSRTHINTIFTEDFLHNDAYRALLTLDATAEQYISYDVIAHLTEQTRNKALTDPEKILVEILCAAYAQLHADAPNFSFAVNYLNNHLSEFPSWTSSNLYKSKNAPHYENAKSDSSYFF